MIANYLLPNVQKVLDHITLDHDQFYSEHCTIGVRKFSLFAAGSIDHVPDQRYILQVFYRLRQPDVSWE